MRLLINRFRTPQIKEFVRFNLERLIQIDELKTVLKVEIQN